jgi:hypothetical protein
MTTAASHIQSFDRSDAFAGSRVLWLPVTLAVLFIGMWAFTLSRSIMDPLGPDQAFFQYIADRIETGGRLYVDVYDENGPGIAAIHLLATRLFGASAQGFRTFDACWETLTLFALAALAMREGRRWATGLFAATLYLVAYHSMGYMHTGQREGFAVLPMLLAAHCVVALSRDGGRAFRPGRTGHTAHYSRSSRSRRYHHSAGSGLKNMVRFTCHVLAGGLCAAAMTLKPTLGLCFAVLWLQAVMNAGVERRRGLAALIAPVGLTMGFAAAVGGVVHILMRVGSWSAYWPLLLRRDPRVEGSYIVGHYMVLELMPRILAASVIIILVVLLAYLWSARPRPGVETRDRARWYDGLQAALVGAAAFALILSATYWELWRFMLFQQIGLVVAATGALLARPWLQQSRTWRTMALLAVAGVGSVLVQGNFNGYHFYPLLACACYLAADEIGRGFHRFRTAPASHRLWVMICVGLLCATGYNNWWRRIVTPYPRWNVLEGTTLTAHYDDVLRSVKSPRYLNKLAVAERVRALTGPDDPIAVLYFDPWMYHLAERPPAHSSIYVDPSRFYDRQFPEFLRTIAETPPKIVLAWVPPSRLDAEKASPEEMERATFDELEDFFGPDAQVIRERFHLLEVVGQVCLLQPS